MRLQCIMLEFGACIVIYAEIDICMLYVLVRLRSLLYDLL